MAGSAVPGPLLDVTQTATLVALPHVGLVFHGSEGSREMRERYGVRHVFDVRIERQR